MFKINHVLLSGGIFKTNLLMIFRTFIGVVFFFGGLSVYSCTNLQKQTDSSPNEILLQYQEIGGMDMYSIGDNVGFEFIFTKSGEVQYKQLIAKSVRPLKTEADSVRNYSLSREQKKILDDLIQSDDLGQELAEIKQRMVSKTEFIGPSTSITLRNLDFKTTEQMNFSLDTLVEEKDQKVTQLIVWIRSLRN
ncbi:MAG: hypothetical protein CL670_00725 [Balneola sp.]|jgi:hypothetical protein|nr:hypothetical protein [Balneola sp.]|tara:strand:+ start:346 stop:921 length:576 start_codon:yes stop_codon:yes gene_type:complete